MAKVSHQYAAMRRYPIDPQSSNGLHTQMCVPSSQKDPNDNKATSKKTWGQRLKISKNEQSGDKDYNSIQFSNNCSALSKSMKYTEPWLYGTVRGIPAPRPDGMMSHMMPHEVAIVVCSCPEYLNGTKKEMKKATICKKCKGSRLPLAPMGGTMRIRSQQNVVHTQFRGSAGTVRLPSTTSMGGSKKRPSILNQNDPYDLMRRSRLLSPELQPVKSVKDILKHRTKSTSPCRSRSRTRRRSPSPNENSFNKNNRSQSASQKNAKNTSTQSSKKQLQLQQQQQQECWIDTSETDTPTRRSILRYDVNPYDLIAKTNLHNNEFSPLQDDGNVFDTEILEHSKKYENLLDPMFKQAEAKKKVEGNGYTAIAGQRMRLFAESNSPITNDSFDDFEFDYDTVTVENGHSQPKRQVRNSYEENGNLETSPNNDVSDLLIIKTPQTLSRVSSFDSNATVVTIISNTQNINIKSILKRPSNECYENMNVTVDMQQQPEKSTTTKNSSNINDNTENINNNNNYDNLNINAANNKVIVRDLKEKRNSGSHFYLPLPGNKTKTASLSSTTIKATPPTTTAASTTNVRKKVQFLVANEIIKDDINENENNPVDENNEINKNNLIKNSIEIHKDLPDSSNNNKQNGNNNSSNKKSTINKVENIKDANPIVHQNSVVEKRLFSSVNDATIATLEDNQIPIDNFPRRGVLRRSFSERHKSTVGPIPQFLDTMALRVKHNRNDSRNLFENDLKSRPRDPPPPPPPKRESSIQAIPERPPRTSSRKTSNEQELVQKVMLPEVIKELQDHKVFVDYNESENIYEDCEPSLVSVNQNNKTKTKFVTNGSPDSKQSTKTVVKIAPLIISPESPAIHRLKIKHDNNEADYDELKQQKTSILISGDDCYSTVNVNDDTQLYQSSVVVNDISDSSSAIHSTSSNTVTISVNSPARTPEEDITYKNNKKNTFLSINNTSRSIIPIGDSNDTSQNIQISFDNLKTSTNYGKTFINLDYSHKENIAENVQTIPIVPNSDPIVVASCDVGVVELANNNDDSVQPIETKNDRHAHFDVEAILRDPVEAVKRNLIPHICGKDMSTKVGGEKEVLARLSKDSCSSTETVVVIKRPKKEVHFDATSVYDMKETTRNSFISRLLEDPTLGHLAEGLDDELIAKLIENSLIRLKESRNSIDMSGTKDDTDVKKMIDVSLQKVQEERVKLESKKQQLLAVQVHDDHQSNRSSLSSGNSYGSSYELLDFENAGDLSDCYHSCSSELTTDEDGNVTRSKFYQMLVDATLSEIEISNTAEDDHHYESIRLNGDPIYEEISEIPPPLPLSPPPMLDDTDLDKKNSRSIFEGASKYDILSYLVDAKERGLVPEETYTYNFSSASDIIVEEENEKLGELHKRQSSDLSCRFSQISNISDSSEDTSLNTDKLNRKSSTEIERNDSGVGSETSKSSRSKWQSPTLGSILDKNSPIHLCEDCDGPVETQITDSGVMYAPLVCRKCGKKRAERKEILTEIVETEEKYGRDLQIILEEFYQPMLVAGLLSQDQLSTIFLNTEELLENNQTLAERMRDALDIATEQGDDDFLTVNIGKIFLEAAPMLHAFENYCVRQGAASLLLANLEKEKELLRIFLRVSQMENTVLRRMNLNSFLMVPVQRVTKYPLLLARLFKVTPANHESREAMKQAQEKIELHLNHMNREAKDVPTKLWRRISSSSPNRRSSCEIDMINIKLRKMAVDVLEWNHDDVRFAMEGRLLFTQPNDNNWRRGRTIKLTPVNALLVTNGKPSINYKADKMTNDSPNFSHHTGIREASLLLVREKSGRYTLLREPLYLDRCIICTEADWEDYFEVQEILTKDTFIFKAEDGTKTKQWYSQLQYHSQGMGAWRKRRNALANIMINGMMTRT